MKTQTRRILSPGAIQIGRYLLAGGANTIIGFSLILFFLEYVKLSAHYSNGLSYSITFITSYLLHRRFTFRSNGEKRDEIPRFILIYIGAYIANYVALSLSLEILSQISAQGVASGVFVLTSYIGQKLFVFNDRENFSMTTNIRRRFYSRQALIFTLASCALLSYSYYVLRIYINGIGPFVFGDEALYAEMTHKVVGGDWIMKGCGQYGPLFPVLLSIITESFGINIHLGAKLINIISWLSSCLIAYRISLRLGLGCSKSLLAAALMFVAPFWSFGLVVWGDPLFYFLLFYQTGLLISELSGPRLHLRISLGLVSGLMFLAKPIGIFYIPALAIAYLLTVSRHENLGLFNNREPWLRLSHILISALTIMLPWLARNLFEVGSLLGYNYASQLLKEMLLSNGVNALAPLMKCFFYQISYVIYMSFGFVGYLGYYAYKKANRIPSHHWGGVTYIFFSIIIISVVSAMHMAPNHTLGHFVPNGRYLTQFSPLILIFFCAVSEDISNCGRAQRHSLHNWLILIAVLQASIVFLASPLLVLVPFSFVNNPDLGLLWFLEIFPFDKGIPWRSAPYNQPTLLVLLSILTLTPALFAVITKSKLKRTLMGFILISMAITCSIVQYGGVAMMQFTQKSLNELFIAEPMICGDNVYFDSSIKSQSLSFMMRFWCNKDEIRMISSYSEISPSNIPKPSNPAYFVVSEKNSLTPFNSVLLYSNHDFKALKLYLD